MHGGGHGATGIHGGALLSLTISGTDDWEERFLSGVEAACESYALPLIGGDTISLPRGAARVLGMTAIGQAGPHTPDRAGGRPGDALWVIGTLGDSAAGLAQLRSDSKAAGPLVDGQHVGHSASLTAFMALGKAQSLSSTSGGKPPVAIGPHRVTLIRSSDLP